MSYLKYDAIAANNTNPPPLGAPEGMVPSSVNDTMRDMMAEIRILGDSINDGSLPGAGTPIPLASGGTGAITNTAARTNLDVYSKAESDANYLAAIPAKFLASGTGPTDALPTADVPFSFNTRQTLGMYSPLAGVTALTAGDHTKRLQLSQTSMDVRVPFNIVNSADKETSRVNQSLYSRNQVETLIANLEPIGTIKLWNGTLVNIPAGYNLCDGTNGTIDLRNKFVRGTDIAGLGTTGGADAQTVTFGNMANAGVHDHGALTGGHSLTEAELAAHTHTEVKQTSTTSLDSGGVSGIMINPTTASTGSTGSGTAHTHTIASDPGHSHGGTQVLENRPAFHQLVYIQKTSIVLVPA